MVVCVSVSAAILFVSIAHLQARLLGVAHQPVGRCLRLGNPCGAGLELPSICAGRRHAVRDPEPPRDRPDRAAPGSTAGRGPRPFALVRLAHELLGQVMFAELRQ